MRTTFFSLALVGLAAAAPRPSPQDFDTDALAAFAADNSDQPQGPPLAATVTAQVPTYVSSIAAESASTEALAAAATEDANNSGITIKARAACQPQPSGYGPVPSPDTDSQFLQDTTLASQAQNAATPVGYTQVFSGLQGATQQSGYLGYYTLKFYDTVTCQQKCDGAQGCSAFNVYIERDPSVDPGTGCTNPPSTINYKCSLYGAPVSSGTAVNKGQYRSQFHVVITGSNGYVRNAPPAAQTNFTGPVQLSGAINAPSGTSTYITYKLFSQYDPALCAAACQAQTAYDRSTASSSGVYVPCNFFNIYALSTNGAFTAVYCSLYSVSYGNKYATNIGQYQGSNYVSVSESYGYSLSTVDCGNTNNC